MNEKTVNKLAEIYAIQAEIEGMRAENTQRELFNHSHAYTDNDFCEKAAELRAVVNW